MVDVPLNDCVKIQCNVPELHFKVNALVKREYDGAIAILTSVAERMRIITDVDIGAPPGTNVILSRPDVSGGKR
ncbi:unnamed protein product [Haemonchus placei]|uniref:Molybdopterin molybdenumtransferase MoeA n=1 Tax=Haemonchus placei TaxID=6290 RepID=A0A0N4WNK9_HAEPC|nr:unnamed protein product [Haemonchus placei]